MVRPGKIRFLPSNGISHEIPVNEDLLFSFFIICHFLGEGGKKMRCPKCKGRMHAEKCYDFVRSFEAWKCCLCGELIDPIILSNRARTQNLFMG